MRPFERPHSAITAMSPILSGEAAGAVCQTIGDVPRLLGPWKIDARFNRQDLIRRIEKIARYSERIALSNRDAIDFLRAEMPKPTMVDRAFVYLDPPYYCKGSQLYLNHYSPTDHARFASFLCTAAFKWVMSYDNVAEIRHLYSRYRQVSFDLGYSARNWRIGKELMIIPNHVRFPIAWPRRIPSKFISAADHVSARLPTEAVALVTPG
jgi:hypothetical protein